VNKDTHYTHKLTVIFIYFHKKCIHKISSCFADFRSAEKGGRSKRRGLDEPTELTNKSAGDGESRR